MSQHLISGIASLPARTSSVPFARRFASSLSPLIEADVIERLELLITELLTNSIRHSGAAEHDELVVSLRLSPGRVRIEVTDPGVGFEPAAQQHQHLSSPLRESGFGLTVVSHICDRWNVDCCGPSTTVWAEIDFADRPLQSRGRQ